MTRIPVVYGLFDPRTDELRYVGQTTLGLRRRLSGHIGDAKRRATTYVARWVGALATDGVLPVIHVIESCLFPEMLGDLERKRIAMARKRGARLTNLTDGGDGGMLGWKPSPVTLAKYRARRNHWIGRKHSEESRRLMSETQAATAAACRKRVVDQDGIVYVSITAAALAAGVGPANVSAVLSGKRPHTRRYVFVRLQESQS